MTTAQRHRHVLRCDRDDCDRSLTIWLDNPDALGFESERWGWAQTGGPHSERFLCFSHRARKPSD